MFLAGILGRFDSLRGRWIYRDHTHKKNIYINIYIYKNKNQNN